MMYQVCSMRKVVWLLGMLACGVLTAHQSVAFSLLSLFDSSSTEDDEEGSEASLKQLFDEITNTINDMRKQSVESVLLRRNRAIGPDDIIISDDYNTELPKMTMEFGNRVARSSFDEASNRDFAAADDNRDSRQSGQRRRAQGSSSTSSRGATTARLESSNRYSRKEARVQQRNRDVVRRKPSDLQKGRRTSPRSSASRRTFINRQRSRSGGDVTQLYKNDQRVKAGRLRQRPSYKNRSRKQKKQKMKTGMLEYVYGKQSQFTHPFKPSCPMTGGVEGILCPSSTRGPHGKAVHVCIQTTQLCNNIPDCPGREDEDKIGCMFYMATNTYLKKTMDILTDLSEKVLQRDRRRRKNRHRHRHQRKVEF